MLSFEPGVGAALRAAVVGYLVDEDPVTHMLTAESKSCLVKWVDDPHAVDRSSCLHVFGKDDPAAGLFRSAHNQGVPE
jgi:hypothetical protein